MIEKIKEIFSKKGEFEFADIEPLLDEVRNIDIGIYNEIRRYFEQMKEMKVNGLYEIESNLRVILNNPNVQEKEKHLRIFANNLWYLVTAKQREMILNKGT